MGDLHIQIRLNGLVVEDRVLEVKEPIVVGDFPGSRLLFPGASVRVHRKEGALVILGRALQEGEEVRLAMPGLSVTFGHTQHRLSARPPQSGMDRQFLAAAVVVVLTGGWLDAADGWVSRLPGGVDGASRERAVPQLEQRAGLTAGDESELRARVPKSEGPAHISDDGLTGVGYQAWLRRVIPTDSVARAADRRLKVDPGDGDSRRIAANAAYNSGAYEVARWHYQQLVDASPDDLHALIRLAWSHRRQGHHRLELELYRKVLVHQPEHVMGLSGRAMALVRLGRIDDAQRTFDRLQITAPTHPYTEVTAAIMEAERGYDALAVNSLSRAIEHREALDREMQVELRRDIAVDPLLARLRAGNSLKGMLRRHLGAAAPRRTR